MPAQFLSEATLRQLEAYLNQRKFEATPTFVADGESTLRIPFSPAFAPSISGVMENQIRGFLSDGKYQATVTYGVDRCIEVTDGDVTVCISFRKDGDALIVGLRAIQPATAPV